MKKAVLLYAVLGCMLAGCGSSEESSGDNLYIPPGAHREPIVTKRDTVEAKVVPPAKVDTAQADVPPPVAVAATVPANSIIFTIQVGAFGNEINARRWEEQTKEVLNMPTYLEHDVRANVFRVTIGTFSSREQAAEVVRDIRQRYPTMYRDAWVVESLRSK